MAVGCGAPLRLVGYEGVLGGSNGLKVEADGTLLIGGRDTGCFVGEVDREGMRLVVPVTNGGLDFCGLGEGGIRLVARGYARFESYVAGTKLNAYSRWGFMRCK